MQLLHVLKHCVVTQLSLYRNICPALSLILSLTDCVQGLFTLWYWCCNYSCRSLWLINSFSSETPLQCKLINKTISSIAYNKVVIIATFLDGTQSPWTTQLWCGGNFLACQQALLGLSRIQGWEICLQACNFSESLLMAT